MNQKNLINKMKVEVSIIFLRILGIVKVWSKMTIRAIRAKSFWHIMSVYI